MSVDTGNAISKNYSNIITTIICALVLLVLNNQSKINEELIRLKTIQDINVSNLDKMNTRVIAVERGNVAEMQAWVEKYFARKPQE